MIKLRLQISVLAFMLLALNAGGQQNYSLHIKGVDKDSTFIVSQIGVPVLFSSRMACMEYMVKLPSLLQAKGYVTSSIDSIHYDSLHAQVVLFLGEKYYWAKLDVSAVDPALLEQIGWREKVFVNKPMDFTTVATWQNKILTYLENNGHPFAKVSLDSVQLQNEQVNAQLKVDKGQAYKIDSIRVYGTMRISNNYLQRYLGISNGSVYSKEKLDRVSPKMRELTWVQEEHPSTLTLLG